MFHAIYYLLFVSTQFFVPNLDDLFGEFVISYFDIPLLYYNIIILISAYQ